LGTGKPAHPTRKIFSDPAVYEFAHPIPGSYPPWYDPSYWYEGVRPHVLLKGQLWALFRAANLYLKIFSKSGALWVVLAAIWVVGRKALRWGSSGAGTRLVFLPSAAALGMYSLVLVEFRYVAPFALMLLLWTLARIGIVVGAEPQLMKRFHLVVVLAPALAAGWAATHDLYDLVRNEPYEPWVVAQKLHEMGIPAGTDVGYIGAGTDAYWAHLAGVRIIVEIREPSSLASSLRIRREGRKFSCCSPLLEQVRSSPGRGMLQIRRRAGGRFQERIILSGSSRGLSRRRKRSEEFARRLVKTMTTSQADHQSAVHLGGERTEHSLS